MEEVNVSGKTNAGNGMFAVLCCAIYFVLQSLKYIHRTSIASLDPETIGLPAFSILSTMFTRACGPPEKLSLALVARSNVLRMTVKLTRSWLLNSAFCQPKLTQFDKVVEKPKNDKFTRVI